MNRMRIPPRTNGPVRLGTGGRATVYVIAGGLWVSGGLWLLFHYFLRRASDFGLLEPHPLEPWWLRLHGAFAFAGLWLVGFLSARHIVNGWASRRRRVSGLAMLSGAGILVLSGYLVYYLGDDQARGLVSLGHWGLGLGAPALFLWHRFALARPRRANSPAPSPRMRMPSVATFHSRFAQHRFASGRDDGEDRDEHLDDRAAERPRGPGAHIVDGPSEPGH